MKWIGFTTKVVHKIQKTYDSERDVKAFEA